MMANRKKFGTIPAFSATVIFVLFVVAGFAQAATWNVPGDSATIQGGIDLASYGDTVNVAAGTYVELITLKNGVALIGAGQSTTTIDGNDADSVVTSNVCDPNTVLDGFAITNGSAINGGGIYISGGSPTVKNCVFGFNTANQNGGGMYNWVSSPSVTNCMFFNNSVTLNGGGMYNSSSSPTVTNCTFYGNSVDLDGGGIYNSGGSPTVTNCILWGNSATSGANEVYNFDSTPVISHCDIAGCGGSGAWDTSFGTDGGGNIDADPLFTLDKHLQTGSPCVDAGDNDSVPEGITTDLDSLPRIVNMTVDMGAYENQDLTVICVDTNASGANNGLNWGDAFNYLQDGLAAADYGDEILVAEGSYRPDEDTNDPCGTEDRGARFLLNSGVAIYGGFPTGGSDFADRDPDLYETILSGDLHEDDGPNFANNDENSFHVVMSTECEPNAILDGFTITGGNADSIVTYGGGMFNDGGEPTIVNCTFRQNSASDFGGGMHNELSSPAVIRCNFIGNSAGYGGGLFNNGENPIFINCSLIGNSAGSEGGGMYNKYSESVLMNCVLSGNSAHSGMGGGMFNLGLDPVIVNCTFSNNAAHDGGGMYNYYSDPIITNCIMWGDTASTGDEIWNDTSNPVISYSDIAGCGGSGAWDSSFGTDGGGNIDDDPLFKDADGDDNIVGTKDDNLELAHESPCIDAGDSNSVPTDYGDLDEDGNTSEQTPLDLAGRSRFTDDPVMADTGNGTPPIVDMGAYERYEFCGSAEFPYPPGDEDHNCIFNLADLGIMVQYWLQYLGPE